MSIAEATTPTAQAMLAYVDRLLEQGQNAKQVRADFVDRYGEFVLMDQPERPAESAPPVVQSQPTRVTEASPLEAALKVYPYRESGLRYAADLPLALAMAARRLDADPDDVEALVAMTRGNLSDLRAAAGYNQRALEAAPDSVDARIDRAFLMSDCGGERDAVRLLRTVLRDAPENGRAHAGMGRAFLKLGKVGKAESSFERALALGEDDPLVHAMLGILEWGYRHPEHALPESRQRLCRELEILD